MTPKVAGNSLGKLIVTLNLLSSKSRPALALAENVAD